MYCIQTPAKRTFMYLTDESCGVLALPAPMQSLWNGSGADLVYVCIHTRLCTTCPGICMHAARSDIAADTNGDSLPTYQHIHSLGADTNDDLANYGQHARNNTLLAHHMDCCQAMGSPCCTHCRT